MNLERWSVVMYKQSPFLCFATTIAITDSQFPEVSAKRNTGMQIGPTVRPMHSKLRTLIVDDNPTNLKILRRTLTHHFSHLVDLESILEARDGQEALALYEQFPFDLILLDIDMPVLSGIDVAKDLRTRTENPIIIACTTSDSPAARKVYAEVGMDGCVCKPFNLRELDELLMQALRSRAYLNSYAQGRFTTRSSVKFRMHHGSLPAISVAALDSASRQAPALSDTALDEPEIGRSGYFLTEPTPMPRATKHGRDGGAGSDDEDDLFHSLHDSDSDSTITPVPSLSLAAPVQDHLVKRPRTLRIRDPDQMSSVGVFDIDQ